MTDELCCSLARQPDVCLSLTLSWMEHPLHCLIHSTASAASLRLPRPPCQPQRLGESMKTWAPQKLTSDRQLRPPLLRSLPDHVFSSERHTVFIPSSLPFPAQVPIPSFPWFTTPGDFLSTSDSFVCTIGYCRPHYHYPS